MLIVYSVRLLSISSNPVSARAAKGSRSSDFTFFGRNSIDTGTPLGRVVLAA